MKIILTLSLCLLVLFGCGQEEKLDGKVIYNEASEKMSKLDALTSVTEITAEFKLVDGNDGQTSKMSSISKLSATGIQGDDLSYQMDLDSNFWGKEISMQQWYIDGVVYAMQDNQRFKFNLNDEDEDGEIIDQDSFTGLEIADAFELDAKKSGSKTIINISLKHEEVLDMLEELELGIDESIVEQEDFEMSDIEIVINEDGYFESQSFNLSFTVDGLIAKMMFKITFSDFNDVKIEQIDKSSFNDINDVLANPTTFDNELVEELGEVGYQPYDETNFVKQVGQEVFVLNIQGMFISYNEHMFLINENTYFDGNSSCIFNVIEKLVEGECDHDALKRAEYLAAEANIVRDILD